MGTMTPDGDNIALGKRSDLPATDNTGNWSIVSMLKGLYSKGNNGNIPFSVASGAIPGAVVRVINGARAIAVPATPETIWNGPSEVFAPLTAAGTISLKSDNAADASVGTGARTVVVEGLNAAYAPLVEVVAMNGVTPVVTVGSFIAVNSIYTATTGATGYNEGSIIATRAAKTMAIINPISNISKNGFHTVAAGKKLHVFTVVAGSQVLGIDQYYVNVWARYGASGPIYDVASIFGNTRGGDTVYEMNGALVLPEKSFLRFDMYQPLTAAATHAYVTTVEMNA